MHLIHLTYSLQQNYTLDIVILILYTGKFSLREVDLVAWTSQLGTSADLMPGPRVLCSGAASGNSKVLWTRPGLSIGLVLLSWVCHSHVTSDKFHTQVDLHIILRKKGGKETNGKNW